MENDVELCNNINDFERELNNLLHKLKTIGVYLNDKNKLRLKEICEETIKDEYFSSSSVKKIAKQILNLL